MSTMLDHRTQIRNNNFLNKLLHDNTNGLRSIYERYKNDSNLFTLECANNIFEDLQHPDYSMTPCQIQDQFVLSLMTVIDETKINKYVHLVFVEFLELICRVALVGLDVEDLIEYKVHMMLEIIYKKQYDLKEMNKIDNPLRPVDEKFKHHKL